MRGDHGVGEVGVPLDVDKRRSQRQRVAETLLPRRLVAAEQPALTTSA